MSSPYRNLTIAEITRETSDAVTIHLEHPDRQIIPYKPGQFLTLILPVNGKEERRSYSLCSTPSDGARLSLTVKRVRGGAVSNFLIDQARVGQEIKVMDPLGHFYFSLQPESKRHVLLFGAGSGITPLMSILKTVLREEPGSKVTLLYGNRNEDTVIFRQPLAQLQTLFPDRLHIEYIYSQPTGTCTHCSREQDPKQEPPKKASGFFSFLKKAVKEKPPVCEHRGRMNRSSIIKILERLQLTKSGDALYYVCGPAGMMEEVQQALKLLKVPQERVFRESFVTEKLAGKVAAAQGAVPAADEPAAITTQTITLIYEGAEYKVEVQPDQTILEAALAQNIDMPYSCQAGLCTACRGKCLQGKIHMDEREGLSDAELDEGYVLNCVGHPLTDDVVIEIG
ncbi:ferredoxin--NADP reductase [Pontibacter qinzhouensis]|uniref:Ferredoxin--NADP reductase n=1 Tax=Pontibacter qinzhouensis TaxID=2603253 RepID=A0A5C8JE89_9BACT|nr:ferredoxin--NADP reductase [Pontibacter qinzhouensis]TXK36755.1 ferredoxin--NADP reductase [Pontibacter qinzhouensis]